MSAAALQALAESRQILGMDSSQERFTWAEMTAKDRRTWLCRAGVLGSFFMAQLTWHELPARAREKLRAVA